MMLDVLRKKKPSREEEQERRRTATILDDAMAQRSKVHVKFDAQASNLTGVSANILAMNDAGLVLELGGVSSLKDRFIGQKITCFFKMVEREQRHREIFYTFDATILRIRQQSEKPPHIAISFPESLHGAQRRKSLRMRPDMEQFSHLAIWRYDAAGGFDITKPTISLEHFKSALAVLENISAGGLRLVLRRTLLHEKSLAPKKGDRYILFMFFGDVESRLRTEYWLVCKTNNIIPDPISHDTTLGLEFVANGERQQDSSKVEWSKIEDNIIDDLAQRIYQWHLTLYREKGLS